MSLKSLAMSRLATLIVNVRFVDDVKLLEKGVKYLQQLPLNLMDDLFSLLVDTNDECVSSNEVAILMHSRKQKLIIDDLVNANGTCFDFRRVLEIAGSKMANLTQLQLPVACDLPFDACAQLCSCAKHLTRLNLYCVKIDDESMQFIARLSNLRELNLNYTKITDSGAKILCDSRSVAKKSLRVIRTYGSRMSARGHAPFLDTMPNLEDVDSNYATTTLLRFFASSKPFLTSLRRLRSTPIRPDVVLIRDMKFALKSCPKLESVELKPLVRDPEQILSLFAHFLLLSQIEIRLDNTLDFAFEKTIAILMNLNNRLIDLNIDNFPSDDTFDESIRIDFPFLDGLALTDRKSRPIASRSLVRCLTACPRLKRMRLTCTELTEDVAALVSVSLFSLEFLSISNCTDLSVDGAVILSNLPSLKSVTMTDSLSRDQQRQLFERVDADKIDLFCSDRSFYF